MMGGWLLCTARAVLRGLLVQFFPFRKKKKKKKTHNCSAVYYEWAIWVIRRGFSSLLCFSFNLFSKAEPAQSTYEKVIIISLLWRLSSTLHCYLIYCTLDYFDIKWLFRKYCSLASCVPLIFVPFYKRRQCVESRTCMPARPHVFLDLVASQACISLFTNLSLQSVRPYSEAMTFTQSTVSVHACVFPPIWLWAQNPLTQVQLTYTYVN